MASEATMVDVGECADNYGDPVLVQADSDGDVFITFNDGNGIVMAFSPERLSEFRELLDRAAMPGQPRYRPCCIHCEHDGESDPDLDHERHPNPCTEGCRA